MKILLSLVVLGLCILFGAALNWATLHFAWGLEVKSWGAFFGFWLLTWVNYIVMSIATAVIKE